MERYNDDELLYLVHCGSEEAQQILYKRYYAYVKNWVLCFCSSYICGYEFDDFVQIGMMNFATLIDQYRDDKETSFKTFMKNCVISRLKSFVKRIKSSHELQKQTVMSLDEYVTVDHRIKYEEILGDPVVEKRPDKIMVIKETETFYQTTLHKNQTLLETQVYELKKEGFLVDEIAKKLDISLKSVYNAAYRYHKKAQAIDEFK